MCAKKKMAIISSTDYLSYPMGGMMSFILDSIPYLKDDFDITLWGVKVDDCSVNNIKIDKEYYPLKTFATVTTKSKLIPNFLKVIIGIWHMRNEISKEGYDVLYFHGIPLSFPFFNKSVKTVNHIHGMTNPFSMTANKFARNKLSISLYENYRNWIVEKSDLIFLASDKQGHAIFSSRFEQIKEKIKYLPNFADSKIFSSLNKTVARKNLGINEDDILLVNTGRVSLQKDPILLFQSFCYLYKTLKINSKLIIIGDGELRGRLEELIKKENLESQVIITGKLSRNEINLWLNSADLYVYTSHANGFPISLAESSMCGLPIVTTDVTGVHDLVINNYSGFLVKERNPEKIAKSIEMALEMRNEFGKNISAISKNFQPDFIVGSIKEEILKII